uniref:Reverse transcriptase domain-containing protein n=1 Tax=Anguilla anguilla TaxID=7936 RepID=A0A0E9U5N1_ANGAN
MSSYEWSGKKSSSVDYARRSKIPLISNTGLCPDDGPGTDAAVATWVHLTMKHLESQRAYVRMLSEDFSSAFDTIPPHVLSGKLNQLSSKINPFVIKRC